MSATARISLSHMKKEATPQQLGARASNTVVPHSLGCATWKCKWPLEIHLEPAIVWLRSNDWMHHSPTQSLPRGWDKPRSARTLGLLQWIKSILNWCVQRNSELAFVNLYIGRDLSAKPGMDRPCHLTWWGRNFSLVTFSGTGPSLNLL